MTDATEITNVVFSALSDRNGFDHWFDQIDDELQAEIKTEIAEAIAALRTQPVGQYLCNGTPFKVAVRNGDAMLPYLPDELGGRWVALVAAEDDCHLRAQPDHSEQHLELVSAARAVVDRWDTPSWKDVPATAVYINRLRDALQHLQAIGEAKE